MTDVDLVALLDKTRESVETELESKPEVINKGDDIDVSTLPVIARKWYRLRDGIAVVADLKSSTQLGLNKHQASTASIYQASTGSVADILAAFGANFIAIQGDGAFGLYWGKERIGKAICAAITIKTFSSEQLTQMLRDKWKGLPDTGLKVGVANSALLVKKIGIPRTDHQEPVWAGRAVNYAAKAAQQADRDELIVTGSIWDWCSENDYLAMSCGCVNGTPGGVPTPSIWKDVTIDKIPEPHAEREGKLLTSSWCNIHGPEFCDAILSGKRRRSGVTDKAIEANKREMSNAIRANARKRREDHRNRMRGLR